MRKRLIPLVIAVVLTWLNPGCSFFIPSHHDPLDYKPIHAAAGEGDLSAVKSLIEKDPQLVDAKDWEDLTPLHLAVLHGHKEVVVFLLEKGAKVNAKTKAYVTPLHFAAQTGSTEIAGILLAHKAKLNAIDTKGWTPFDRAVKWSHPEVAEFLKQRGGHPGEVQKMNR